MALIKRLKRITLGRIEAFLRACETPEVVFPQLVRDMGDKIKLAINAEAKARSAQLSAQRKLDEANGKLLRYQQGSGMAARLGDGDTARRAAEAQLKVRQEIERRTVALEKADRAHDDARATRLQLQEQYEVLKDKRDDILERVRVLRARQDAAEVQLPKTRRDNEDLLDIVARMQERVDTMEAELDIRDQINRDDTD